MSKKNLSLNNIVLLAGTRALLGIGLGLLISELLPKTTRRLIGSSLLTIGVVSTLPLALQIFAAEEDDEEETELL